jgi:hypothetical protein
MSRSRPSIALANAAHVRPHADSRGHGTPIHARHARHQRHRLYHKQHQLQQIPLAVSSKKLTVGVIFKVFQVSTRQKREIDCETMPCSSCHCISSISTRRASSHSRASQGVSKPMSMIEE